MGILSKVASYATKVAPKLFNYGTRAVKATPKLIFGTNSDAVGSAMRSAFKSNSGSIWSSAKSAIKAGGKVLESGATGKAFFRAILNDVKTLPKALCRSTKAGALIAKHAGKSSIWGGIKGFFGGVGKKMPLIGTLITIGLELPNIYSAGKDRGVGEALKETGKAAARLAGGAAGAAIGSAICPGIGSLVGWCVGEWLTGLVVGKSYSDQKDEAIDKLKEMGATDEDIEAAEKQGVDIIDKAEEIEAQQNASDNTSDSTSQTTTSQQTQTESSQQQSGTTTQQAVNKDPYGFGQIINMLNNHTYTPYIGMNSGFGNLTNPFTTPYLMQYQQSLNFSA